MKLTVAIVLAFALAACGDRSPTLVEATPDDPDARGRESFLFLSTCNPVVQTGCITGERCTWQHVTDDVGRVACVPDGAAENGSSCSVLPPGETTGYDDCVGGQYCLDGICKEICTDSPDSCPAETGACTQYSGLFDCSAVALGVCE